MKIQLSDIGRFLQLACKMWKWNYEGDSLIVVFTVTQRACSIAMARDGLLLTYLCDRVDSEASEQVIAVLVELLHDCTIGTGVVDLQKVVKNGARHIEAEWSEGLIRCKRSYSAQAPPEYHLMPDLAWHTVDERIVRQGAARYRTEKRATSHRVNSCPIEPIATVPG